MTKRNSILISGFLILLVILLCLPTQIIAEEKEVKIGILVPLSGSSSEMGRYSKEVAIYGVKDINESGGLPNLGGAKIKLIFADTQSIPNTGITEAERLITKEKIDLLMGCCNTAVTKGVQSVCEKYKCPLVILHSIGNIVTERGYKYSFRAHDRAADQAREFWDFLYYYGKKFDKKVKTVAYLYEDSEYARNGMEMFKLYQKESNLMGKSDYKTVYEDLYPQGMNDFSSQILKLKEAQPDLLISCGWTADISLLARQMRDYDFCPNIHWYEFGLATLDPPFLPLVKELADHMTTVYGSPEGLAKLKPKEAQEWIEAYKKANPSPMTGDVSKAIVGVYTGLEGIKQSKEFSREAIREALASLDITGGPVTWVSVVDRVKFDEKGQNMYAYAGISEIVDGVFHWVWPLSAAEPSYEIAWPIPSWKER